MNIAKARELIERTYPASGVLIYAPHMSDADIQSSFTGLPRLQIFRVESPNPAKWLPVVTRKRLNLAAVYCIGTTLDHLTARGKTDFIPLNPEAKVQTNETR